MKGLSFEIAPPAAVHPLRTDIACFVGTVARRTRLSSGAAQALPVVLQRWLRSHRVERVGGLPLAQLRVPLASAAQFAAGLLALAASAAERATLQALFERALARSGFERLVDACARLTPLPEALVEDLRVRGFEPRALLGIDEAAAWLRVQQLHNLPVALESFEAFDALFAWEQRGIRGRAVHPGDPVVATPLGVALRAFFGEGGRRCYVVRSGDPSGVFDAAAERFAACFPEGAAGSDAGDIDREAGSERCAQLPGVRCIVRGGLLAGLQPGGRGIAVSAADWVGLEHVYGLPDVNFALLPDLIDACAQSLPSELPPPDEVIAAPQAFVECVHEDRAAAQAVGRRLPPPRLDTLGLEVWRRLVCRAAALLDNPGRAFHRRDVQLLASLPLAGNGRDAPAPASWLAWMQQAPGWLTPDGDGTALLDERVQLAYPWLRSAEGMDAQGGIEAPEGSLAGVLSRSALERGAYRSAAWQPLRRWLDSEPAMPWTQAMQQAVWTALGPLSLADRLCLLGPSPRGPRLLSDVTCSVDARTRQGAVRRLINVVIQAACRAGDEFAFEANGEALWARVRERLSDLLRALLAAGALSSDGVPFAVRCGRDTMRQNDLDAGRLIAHIEIQPAQPIQRIVVVLNLRDASTAAAWAAAA